MKNSRCRFSSHALLVCGLAAVGFQLPAQAQSLTTTAIPSTVVGTARAGASFTIRIANDGPGEAFGVTLSFTPPKGTKIASPANCTVLSKNTGATKCLVGYIAQSANQQLNFKITATKPGSFSADFSAVCTAVACGGGKVTVPITLN